MNDQPSDIATPSDTRHLLVACGDAATRRSVEGFLATATPAPAVTGCDGVEAALAQDPAAPVIVPVTLPLDHLGAALQAGTAPDEALADWRAGAEALLRTCRKARRRVLMIDRGMIETQPDACAQALGARLDLHLGAIPPTSATGAERPALHTAIAAPLLASDANRTARAMLLGPVSPRAPAPAEIGEAVETAAILHEERDLLRENLADMLSQTEGMRGALTRKEQQTSTLEEQAARTDNLEDRLAQAESDCASLAEERDLLRETLAQMLGETERLLGNENDLKRTLDARNTELADKHLLKAQLDAEARQIDMARDTQRWRDAVLGGEVLKLASQAREDRIGRQAAEDEIARLRDSTSWKVTRPLRAVRRGLRRS